MRASRSDGDAGKKKSMNIWCCYRDERREKGPLRLLDGAGIMGMGVVEVPSCGQLPRVGK